MKRTIFAIGLTLVLSAASMAQKTVKTNTSASAEQATTVGPTIAAGTQVSGELQNSLDVQKAKVGDEVLLKTTRAVKQNGQTVIGKGSTLVGRVTQVERKTKENAGSSVGIFFDHIQQGANRIPIDAVITSIVQANASASYSEDNSSDMMASSSGRSLGSGNSGGVLNGAGNVVGSAASATTNTTGNVANIVGQTVDNVDNTARATTMNTTNAATNSVRGLTISQSTNASASGGSMLSMTGGNLHLEKGVTFNLDISSSASVGKN